MIFSKEYWNERYSANRTGWDIGDVSTPLREYFEQLSDTNLKILIPGCGNAYEALYLFKHNFKQVYILDYSDTVIASFKKEHPNFPEDQILCEDFFKHQHKYDLIIEQTFFCALYPGQRSEYAIRMNHLLNQGGKVVGLLFDREFEVSPPYGGSKTEYLRYFQPFFKVLKMELCYNSIEARKGSELFIILEKI